MPDVEVLVAIERIRRGLGDRAAVTEPGSKHQGW
jgi:hypothetical protein